MSLIECGAPGTNRVVCVTGQICDEKVKNTLKIVIKTNMKIIEEDI